MKYLPVTVIGKNVNPQVEYVIECEEGNMDIQEVEEGNYEILRLVPNFFGTVKAIKVKEKGKEVMFGERFVYAVDSRFNKLAARIIGVEHFYGAISIHDEIKN